MMPTTKFTPILFVTAIMSALFSAGCQPHAATSDAKAVPDTPPVTKAPPVDQTDGFPADQLLDAIRSQSVHRGQVDWAKAEPEFRARIATARNDDEKAGAVTQLFASMNDVHSYLQVGEKRYGHYEGVDEETRRKVVPLLERERAQSGKIVAAALDGGFGYVLVPSMGASTIEQVEQMAKELRQRVSEIAATNPKGWIVDLRVNGGGNLYPMLVGLAPLLGDGVVGGTMDADGRQVQEWVLKSDGLYWRDATGDRRFVTLDLPVTLSEPVPPVVVLIGPITGSSGEATALAFKGRPRCILLGEPTAKGYTTVIQWIPINQAMTLSLAVGYMTDRGGTACRSQIFPDETVEGADAFDALLTDPKVQAAIKQLHKSK